MTISSADEFYGGILNGFGEYNVTQFRTRISESWNGLSEEKRFRIAKEAGLSKNDATAIYRQSFESITPYLRERIEQYELFEAYKGDSIKNPNAEFNKDVVTKARPLDPNKDRKDKPRSQRDAIDSIAKADDDINYNKLIGYMPEPNKDIGDNRTQVKGGIAKTPKGNAKESLICANCGKTVVQSDHPDHLGICGTCTLLPTAQKMDAYAKIDAEQKDRNHPFNKGMRGESDPTAGAKIREDMTDKAFDDYEYGSSEAILPYGNEFDRVTSGQMEGKDRAGQGDIADNVASIAKERVLQLSKEVWANEVDGDYIFDGQVVGRVTDLKPTEWFGKVMLNSMPEMAEYGTLDPQATVQGDDGNLYSDPQGGSDGSRGTLLAGGEPQATVSSYDNDDDFFKALGS